MSQKYGGPTATDERSKPFKFRHFVVYQDRCAMKVGTDAMLLGSWASPPAPAPSRTGPGSCCRILDVGTGTGVLALMMAQKTSAAAAPPPPPTNTTLSPPAEAAAADEVAAAAPGSCDGGAAAGAAVIEGSQSSGGHGPAPSGGGGGGARIVAIDVDLDACAQAAENAACSPWADRIRVLHCSLQQLAAATAGADPPPGALVDAAAATRCTAASAACGGDGEDYSNSTASAEPAARQVAPPVGETARSEPPTPTPLAGFAAEDCGPFDLIISNPPYFVESSKPAPGRAARASARHADVSLPFSDLAAGCEALLARGGSVCVVLPPVEAQRFSDAAAACGLVMVELLRVFTAPEDARERRHLMRLQRAADLPYTNAETSPKLPHTSTLTINGPKHQHQHQQLQGRTDSGAAAADACAATRSGGAGNGGEGGRTSGAARRLTAAYVALTADFHDPAYLLAHRPAAADAGAADADTAADTAAAHTEAPADTRAADAS